MIQKLSLSFLFLVLIFLLVGCGSTDQVSVPDADPGDVVREFFDWYLGDRSGPPKDPRESDFLAETLVTRIDEMMESSVPVDQVSFVCAQDFPDTVEVVSSEIDGENAEVLVRTSFGTNVRLMLQPIEGQWRIYDVKCE